MTKRICPECGHEYEDKWGGQGGEKLCQVRELIRQLCPSWWRTRESFYVSDLDIAIIDETNNNQVISLYEKKIGDASYETWQQKFNGIFSTIIKEGMDSLKIKGEQGIYGGFHTIRVPDNKNWTMWKQVKYDDQKVTIDQLVKLLSNEHIHEANLQLDRNTSLSKFMGG